MSEIEGKGQEVVFNKLDPVEGRPTTYTVAVEEHEKEQVFALLNAIRGEKPIVIEGGAVTVRQLDTVTSDIGRDWDNSYHQEFQAYMRKKAQRKFEKTFKEARQHKEGIERHLFIPDLQIPDHNTKALRALMNFIPDYAPDTVHIMGDLLNMTKASSYEQPVGYDVTLSDEIEMGKVILKNIVDKCRKANPIAKILYYEGNHEDRLNRYLMRNAQALADLEGGDGERVVSLPHLLGLKEMGVKWIPYTEVTRDHDIIVEHGDIARSKSGFTAHGMLDRRGRSGFSVHTHRLALVTRNQSGDEKFWMECGSLCNTDPLPRYVKKPDWINGFAVGIYDKQSRIFHPCPIMMQKNEFTFGGKIYKG